MRRFFAKVTALILALSMVAAMPAVSFADSTDNSVTQPVAASSEELGVNITYSELKTGEPVTFTVNASGLSAEGPHKYRLHNVSRYEGNDLNLVVDPTRLPAYTISDTFDFTFTSNGKYRLQFGVMDLGCSPIKTKNVYVTIEINDSKAMTVEQKADKVAAECSDKCKTDYDKALWLHDWLLDNCKYDYTYTYCSAEGALLRGTGTCEAYHRAYEMLLARVGIESGRIIGNGHVWTAVKMDGKWYQVDVTWDDTGGSTSEAQHMYFGLNDTLTTAVHSEHKVNSGYESNSLENNYFVKSGLADSWAEKYVSVIQEQLDKGNAEFDVELINKPSYITYQDTIKNTVIEYAISKHTFKVGGKEIKGSTKYNSASGQEKFTCKYEFPEPESEGSGSSGGGTSGGGTSGGGGGGASDGGDSGATTPDNPTDPATEENHVFETVTTEGGYLHHGETYQRCTICGYETEHICNNDGYCSPGARSVKVTKGKKCFTVKWKKANKAEQKKIDGYEIEYSLSADMTGATTTIAGKAVTAKKIKSLARKTKYYVRVRTYVNVDDNVFYSSWSKTKAIKTK